MKTMIIMVIHPYLLIPYCCLDKRNSTLLIITKGVFGHLLYKL